jgi:hypothetical protein
MPSDRSGLMAGTEFVNAASSPSPALRDLYAAVELLSAEERKRLAVFLHSLDTPKRVDKDGIIRNPRRLTVLDRKSILYLSAYADPKASRDELAAIFCVSRQRVSQIVGAIGHSSVDAALLGQFARAKPFELKDHWRVESHIERLRQFRAGRITPSPVIQRHMKPLALGHWAAYGRAFEVYERDGLFYFLIDLPDELESEPRASAKKALDDCFAACREDAWANSNGDPDAWLALYKEDPLGPAAPANLKRAN